MEGSSIGLMMCKNKEIREDSCYIFQQDVPSL